MLSDESGLDESGRDLSAEDFSFETEEDARYLRHWDWNTPSHSHHWNPWTPPAPPVTTCEPDAFYTEPRRLKYQVLTYAQYSLFYNTLVSLR